ncbi:MAG: hypothetical protein ACLU0O_04765 [Collinsella sp.]
MRELSERVGVMMDLCGQHEHQRLLTGAPCCHGRCLGWARGA